MMKGMHFHPCGFFFLTASICVACAPSSWAAMSELALLHTSGLTEQKSQRCSQVPGRRLRPPYKSHALYGVRAFWLRGDGRLAGSALYLYVVEPKRFWSCHLGGDDGLRQQQHARESEPGALLRPSMTPGVVLC